MKFKWKNIPIDKKLILVILISEIIILSFSSIIITSYIVSQQEEQIYSDAIEVCKSYSNKLNGDLKEILAISKTLSITFEISNINNIDEIIYILKRVVSYDEKIIGSYVCYDIDFLDEKENKSRNYCLEYYQNNKFCPYCIKKSNVIEIKPLSSHDLIDIYFKNKNDISVITTPFYCENKFMMSVFSPIIIKNYLVGVIGVDISLNYIDTIVNSIRIFDSGYAFFVSNNGIFLSHPIDKNFIGLKTLSDLGDPLFIEASNDIRNRKSGIFKTKDPFSNDEIIVFYEPIIIDGSSFLLIIPKREMFESINDLLIKLITISFCSLIFMVLISSIISSLILSSIKKITSNFTEISTKISNGELDIGTNLDIDIDFIPIYNGFNSILQSIKNHVYETKKMIENLEIGNLQLKIETKLKGDFYDIGVILYRFSNNLNNIIKDSVSVLTEFQNNNFSKKVIYYGNGDFKKLTTMIEKTRVEMLKITQNYINSENNLKHYAFNLKRSNLDKQELEIIIDRSPIIIFKLKIDPNWTTLFLSKNISQYGYNTDDFKNGTRSYFDIIHKEDISNVYNNIFRNLNENNSYFIDEYRIVTSNGNIKWIETRIYFNKIGNKYTNLQGISLDITERKIFENKLKEYENVQKKEIHHRIKNNLQVISTLLYLESSKFKSTKVKNAFENSQNRIKSMALIHEELYRSTNVDSQKINFKSYILKLTEYLFSIYKVTNKKISLELNIENIFLSIDIAIPLGTIINELITNSLKYAFVEKYYDCKIWITLKTNNNKKMMLIIGDNGISMKKIPNIEDIDSLGLQLVYTLVNQINGELDIQILNGLVYNISFLNY